MAVVAVVDVPVLVSVKADEPSRFVEFEVTSEAVADTTDGASGIGEEVGADVAVVEVRDGGTCMEHRNEIS